ncbi:MAG: ABC transporter permease [Anaerolineae bacterium]|nr:ABC transporter permease [Anaerolineae bacterium]
MRMAGLYLRLIGARVRSQMQYRTSFCLDALSSLFGTLIGFATLAAVISRFGGIGGWTLGEVAFLYGLAEVSYGLMDLVWGGYDYDFFSPCIRSGEFDQMLLRPIPLPLQILTSEFALRRLGRVAQGVAVFVLGWRLAGVEWTATKVAYLPVVILSAMAFFAALYVVGSAVCFWTVERLEVFNLFTYGGAEMLSYPMHIYNRWLARFFTFVVPAAVQVYYPALYFLGKPDPLGMPAFVSFLAPVTGFGCLALSFAFWSFGVRRYQSTGT